MRRICCGFTFIEMLAALAIVSVLAALLFPVFASVREKGRQASCASNLHQLGLALSAYTIDCDEQYPASQISIAHTAVITNIAWAGQLYSHIKNTDVFRCPTDITPGNGASVVSYGLNLNLASASSLSALAAPTRTVLLFEVSGDHAPITDYAEGQTSETGQPQVSASGNGITVQPISYYDEIVPGFYTDYPNQQFGARELWGKITITEPAALIKGTPGTGCMVQVASLSRGFARTAQNGKPSTFSKISVVNGDGTTSMVAGPTGLDVAFPYPFGSVKNADGTFTSIVDSKYTWPANTDGYSGDQPFAPFTLTVNDGGGNQWYSSTTNDSFNAWVMYCPPANGLGTIYVPLQTLNWSWGGNASLSGGVWSVSQGPQFDPGSPGNASTPPAWNLYIPYGFSIGP